MIICQQTEITDNGVDDVNDPVVNDVKDSYNHKEKQTKHIIPENNNNNQKNSKIDGQHIGDNLPSKDNDTIHDIDSKLAANSNNLQKNREKILNFISSILCKEKLNKDMKHIVVNIKVNNNTLKIEDDLNQYVPHFKNQTLYYSNLLHKAVSINNIVTAIQTMSDYPIEYKITSSQNFILNNNNREKLQKYILELKENKKTSEYEYLKNNPELINLLHTIAKQAEIDDFDLLLKVIDEMFSNLFKSNNVYDFEDKLNEIVKKYELIIPTLSINLHDLYYVVLQKGFKNQNPEEPLGIVNDNEKASIMKEYTKFLSVPFNLNSIHKIVNHANKNGAGKDFRLTQISPNLLKLTSTQKNEKNNLCGIIISFNGEEINPGSLIYSQMLDTFQHTIKETALSKFMKMMSGSNESFKIREYSISQDKQALVEKLTNFLDIEPNIRTNVSSENGNIVISFDIQGKINNNEIKKITIISDKMLNKEKEIIEKEILSKVKNLLIDHKTIYDIDLSKKASISHMIESILFSYGISFTEYKIFNDEFVIQVDINHKKQDKIEISCNMFSPQQISYLLRAANMTRNPFNTCSDMMQKLTKNVSTSNDENRNIRISGQPHSIGFNSPLYTKNDLLQLDSGTNAKILLFLFMQYFMGSQFFKETISSCKFKILELEVDFKKIFKKWDELISITPGINFIFFNLNTKNVFKLDSSFNFNIQIIKRLMDLTDVNKRPKITLLDFLNPELSMKFNPYSIINIDAKYNFPQKDLSINFYLEDEFKINGLQLNYQGSLGFSYTQEEIKMSYMNTKKITRELVHSDVNKKVALMIALSSPDFIAHASFNHHDKPTEIQVPFFPTSDQSKTYSYLSFLFPFRELLNSKKLLGQEMFKIICLLGISLTSYKEKLFDAACGIGVCLVAKNKISIMFYFYIRRIEKPDGTYLLDPYWGLYTVGDINMYNTRLETNYTNLKMHTSLY